MARNLWRAIGSGITACVAFIMATLSCPAAAQPVGLKAGTYQCFTITTMMGRTPSPNDLSEVNRRAAGNPIRPMVPPQLLLAPAAFGNVILDGKGNYRLPSVGQAGRYGFNAATGRPTFTGDLGAMQQGEYSGTGTRFIVGWQGVNYQCGLAGANGASPGQLSDQDRADLAAMGPPLKSVTAANFTGNFAGSYHCASGPVFLRLALSASSDGTMTGIFKFGGMKTPEFDYSVGTFSMKGRWQGAHFTLKNDAWIQRPQGYVMIDIEGDVGERGVFGKVLYAGCSIFVADRSR